MTPTTKEQASAIARKLSAEEANGTSDVVLDHEEGRSRGSTNAMALRHRNSVGSALARHEAIEDAQSLASIDRPPEEELPSSKVYHPFSIPVLALLAPASIFGVLARLGLQALVTYDGQSIFPLAYVQAVGCLIMGIGIGMKEPLGRLYVTPKLVPLPTDAHYQLWTPLHCNDHR